ncbi:uncharacterized protein ACBR49_018582 [Aulostomus maculatus]
MGEDTEALIKKPHEAKTPGDLDESTTNIQEQEEDTEEQHNAECDKYSSSACSSEREEPEVRSIAALSQDEGGELSEEESRVQRKKADKAMTQEEKENCGIVLQPAPENEDNHSTTEELNRDDAALHAESILDYIKTDIQSEDGQNDTGPGKMISDICTGSAIDKCLEEEEEEEEEEEVCGAGIKEESAGELAEAASIQPTADSQERKDNVENLLEESCCEDFAQIVVMTDETPEDVANEAKVQTKPRKKDDLGSRGAAISEKSDVMTELTVEGENAEEEELLGLEDNHESLMEKSCSTTAETVKPEDETGQEVSGRLKNSPLSTCEGHVVVSQQLNTPTCGETRGAVPEYNNEPGPNENTAQWFLEVVDSKEIQTTQLPEEVANKELERSQNGGGGAECLVAIEHMEEEHSWRLPDESNLFTEGGKPSIPGAEPPSEEPLVEQGIQESGIVQEAGLLVSSMKTEISDEECDAQDKDLQDSSEELFDSKEAVGEEAAKDVAGLAADTFLDTEARKMTEMSSCDEMVNAMNLEQNSSGASSLLEDITESEFLKEPVEAKLMECTEELQDAGIEMEEMGDWLQEEAAEDEGRNKNESEASGIVEVKADTFMTKNEHDMFADSELRITTKPQVNLPETLVHLSDETWQTSNEMLEDAGTADESTHPPDEPEETGSGDVIAEDILDLWIRAASSDEMHCMKQREELEFKQQRDTEIVLPNEERDEIQSDTQQEVVVNVEESRFFTDISVLNMHQPCGDAKCTDGVKCSTETLFDVEKTEEKLLEINVSEIEKTDSKLWEAWLAEGIVSTDAALQGEACFDSERRGSLDKLHIGGSENIEISPDPIKAEEAEQPPIKPDHQPEVNGFALDFSAQKSRIAVKNPHVRPPKDPRSLLHKPSVDPIASTHLAGKVPAGVPLVGLGIGIKLPGLSPGIPVLRKTQKGVMVEDNLETSSQEPEAKPEERADIPKHEDTPQKPKWTPPKHARFGNPLMSELKSKLKKTVNE